MPGGSLKPEVAEELKAIMRNEQKPNRAKYIDVHAKKNTNTMFRVHFEPNNTTDVEAPSPDAARRFCRNFYPGIIITKVKQLREGEK